MERACQLGRQRTIVPWRCCDLSPFRVFSSRACQVRVNLVPIRVVVRDAHGLAVPNLPRDDFRVFEDGKLQLISHFSVETPAPAAQPLPETSSVPPAESEKAPAVLVRPARFVALLFDDVHLPFGELARIKNIPDDS